MAELGPQMGSVDNRAAGERPHSLRVAACVQSQIAWPLRKAGVDLHLANHRKRHAALRPPLAQPGLCLGRVGSPRPLPSESDIGDLTIRFFRKAPQGKANGLDREGWWTVLSIMLRLNGVDQRLLRSQPNARDLGISWHFEPIPHRQLGCVL